MFKVSNRKNVLVSLWKALNIFHTLCSSVFNVDFEHVIVHSVGFSTSNIKDFMLFCIENIILLLSFLKNDCFLKIFFPRFKSHFRLVQMTLKSITFVQNHKVTEHFYYNNVHRNNIFHFVSVRNSLLHKQISCIKIKGAIIIHVKFSRSQKLKILRCFRTLHVQIVWF